MSVSKMKLSNFLYSILEKISDKFQQTVNKLKIITLTTTIKLKILQIVENQVQWWTSMWQESSLTYILDLMLRTSRDRKTVRNLGTRQLMFMLLKISCTAVNK